MKSKYFPSNGEVYFNDLPESCKNTLIIDFFDSVGIYITSRRNCYGAKYNHWYYIVTDTKGVHLNDFLEVKIKNDCRKEATTEAIKKANEIYNKNK